MVTTRRRSRTRSTGQTSWIDRQSVKVEDPDTARELIESTIVPLQLDEQIAVHGSAARSVVRPWLDRTAGHHFMWQSMRDNIRRPLDETWPTSSQLTVDDIDDLFAALPETIDLDDPDSSLPSPAVVAEARRIVGLIAEQLPADTDIYVMDEGKVVIDLHGPPKHGLLLVCEPGGSALCVVVVNGVSRRARYESSESLPDGFLREGLSDVLPVTMRRRVGVPSLRDAQS